MDIGENEEEQLRVYPRYVPAGMEVGNEFLYANARLLVRYVSARAGLVQGSQVNGLLVSDML